ncbi:hypothetical protein [Stutzerimonas balearica]|uniref:hypothetical protein n=1 Tax=Stutzerimonas balearica TaxID=74829 RepID=UPI00289713DA|nr:hypothetical protein [Stutzerimonas balearica]
MSKPLQDAAKALSYFGETVLVELAWDDDRETLWRCYHIVGVVLPVPGVYEHGYFLTMPFADSLDFPAEIYFDSIRTLRPMRQRDRAATGNVLGRIALPEPATPWSELPAAVAAQLEGGRRHA